MLVTNKPELKKFVRMRWKAKTDSLVFYMEKGEPKCGIRKCDETDELWALVQRVFEMSDVLGDEF